MLSTLSNFQAKAVAGNPSRGDVRPKALAHAHVMPRRRSITPRHDPLVPTQSSRFGAQRAQLVRSSWQSNRRHTASTSRSAFGGLLQASIEESIPALLLAGVALRNAIVIVGEGDGVLVERLGSFDRQLGSGLHFKIPIVERLAFNDTFREKVLDVAPQQCITADNAPIKADAVVYYKIVDFEMARYKVEELVPALTNLVLTQLRNEVGRLSLDETFSARGRLNSQLLKELDTATGAWGVKVTRVEVRDILPASSISGALEKQMTAERIKRATILESEGFREAALNEAEASGKSAVIEAEARSTAVVFAAEAEKKRRELEAEGLSVAIKSLAGTLGVSTEKAAELYLARDYIEANKEIGQGPGAKVLFMDPSSIPGSVATLGSLLSDDGKSAGPECSESRAGR
ncbi:hypothetical protein CYMTET_24009 [Cymbomonas tetramitiformis]|uniref:Band 7 domain-containing protein n=1 Tax=Cymbomonas tetramitiformis TaxID=36881 RepID=A0AAE0FX91_9CHLO|nr:hypothetical protein CYMTET_24009 [Cymbomonas tetramitiformis]